jgi:hypothetical protein
MKRGVSMKRGYKKYMLPPWAQGFKRVCRPFAVPFCIFQGIRAVLLPTIFDVLLFTIFIVIALALYFEII